MARSPHFTSNATSLDGMQFVPGAPVTEVLEVEIQKPRLVFVESWVAGQAFKYARPMTSPPF
jgi:hypothetical protein